MVGRHPTASRDEDVESSGSRTSAAVPARDRLPEVGRVVVADRSRSISAGMRLARVADDRRAVVAREVDREGEAARTITAGGRRPRSTSVLARVQARGARASASAASPAEAELVQAHPGPHQDREGARRDFGIERAAGSRAHPVELGAAVGDQPGEDVEPAGRALGVGDRRDAPAAAPAARAAGRCRRSPSPAPRRRVRSMRVHREVGELARAPCARARQEAGAHPVGDRRRAAGRGSPAGSGPRRTAGAGRDLARLISARRACDGTMPVVKSLSGTPSSASGSRVDAVADMGRSVETWIIEGHSVRAVVFGAPIRSQRGCS